jgi:hypothetical protein
MKKKVIEVVLDPATGEHKLYKAQRIVNFHDGSGNYLKVTISGNGEINLWSAEGFSIRPTSPEGGQYRLSIRLGR